MYCNFNMFDLNSQVYEIDNGAPSRELFSGTFDEVCAFMANTYQTNKYDKIVLDGPYAMKVEDEIRTYSKINYNFDNINIEVL